MRDDRSAAQVPPIPDELGLARFYLRALWILAAIGPLSKLNLGPIWARDFINYWLAPRAWWSGVNPYDVDAYKAYGLNLFAAANPNQFNFTYPPHSLFIFAPFSVLPPLAAFALWNAVSLGLFYLAARPFLPKGFPALVAVLSPAALINVAFGQTGLLSAALFLLAFRGGGLSAALLTFKPHMGLLVAPVLLARRRTLRVAIVATIVLVIASGALFGGWPDFFDHALNFQGRNLAAGSEYVWVMMATTPFIGYGFVGWAIYGTAAIYLLTRNFNVFTAATATFLISPYGLHYDMAAACMGFAILLYERWDDLPTWHKAAASLAFLTPAIVDFGTWLIPPILLLGLLIQTEWLRGTRLALKVGQGGRLPRLMFSPVNA